MPPGRRITNTCPFKIGARIRPIAMFEHHRYKPDENYVVTQIDTNDRTLVARNAEGRVGRWIRWCDCESIDGIGWDWLKGVLPADALELLSAFDGVQLLALRSDIRKALVAQAPELKGRILNACEALESPNPNP
jgi:hypothetical protein